MIFQRELEDRFGTPGDDTSYLKTMDFSEFSESFAHVRDYEGNKWGLKIYGHKLMESPLCKALGLVVERGLADELKTYDGCFNIRKKKGGSGYSVHSWGMAVDFNAATNPFGGEPTFSDNFVKCFAESGFEWGGLWVPDSIRDGMHFQLPWIRVRTGSLAPVEWEDV